VNGAVSGSSHGRRMRSDLHALSGRLDRDWRQLARTPAAVSRAATWRLVPVVRHLDDVLVATGFGVPHTAANNATLARLVGLARADDLAARVVMQRILPGLLGVARRRRLFERDAFEDLVGAAWLVIRRANPAGKEQLAANLVRDAAYRAFTAPGRRLSATEIAVDPRTLDEEPAPERIGPCEELAMLLADARAMGVPTADLDLFRELAVVGSPGRVAARREITPRTVRNHRDRAAARIRSAAA
jgi:hypothetical protein